MAWPPQVADFKAQFTREFKYGSGQDSVTDGDIQRALNECNSLFNQALFDSATDQQIAYLYLAAHFLWSNLEAAGGLSAINLGRGTQAQGGGVIGSKSVGGVSVNYEWPETIKNSRVLGQFTRSAFGNRYLQMVAPRLLGNMQVVAGPNADQQDALDGSNPV